MLKKCLIKLLVCYKYSIVSVRMRTRLAKKRYFRHSVQAVYRPWWKYFSEFLRNYLRFSDFSDFFRKFSIVSENYRVRNLIFKEKWRNFRFFTNSKKKVSHFLQISCFSSKLGEIEKPKILEKSQKP